MEVLGPWDFWALFRGLLFVDALRLLESFAFWGKTVTVEETGGGVSHGILGPSYVIYRCNFRMDGCEEFGRLAWLDLGCLV